MSAARATLSDHGPGQAGVVLLHGIARTARSMRPLQHALHDAGFATLNLDYASRHKPLQALADDIHPAIAAFARTCDGPLHVVAHSMGGLLTRIYLARHRPDRLGRVVMLGTPNSGSEVADRLERFRAFRAFYGPAGLQLTTRPHAVLTDLPPVDYPLGIIAGTRFRDPIAAYWWLPRPNDGRVSVASARLANMADLITVPVSHTGLLRHPLVRDEVLAFLRDGHFIRSASTQRGAA